MTDISTTGSASTHATKSTGAYANAVQTTATISSETAVAVAWNHTVTASRLDGDVRVRLVPDVPRTGGDNTF